MPFAPGSLVDIEVAAVAEGPVAVEVSQDVYWLPGFLHIGLEVVADTGPDIVVHLGLGSLSPDIAVDLGLGSLGPDIAVDSDLGTGPDTADLGLGRGLDIVLDSGLDTVVEKDPQVAERYWEGEHSQRRSPYFLLLPLRLPPSYPLLPSTLPPSLLWPCLQQPSPLH